MQMKLAVTLLVVVFAVILVLLLWPAPVRVLHTPAWQDSARNLTNLGVAFHSYHDQHRVFPPPTVTSPDGKPLLSWRVETLRYLEFGHELYRDFNRDEPWDSAHNHRLLKKRPYAYVAIFTAEEGQTHYQGLVGPGTAFERAGLRLQDFPDGLENTILVVEASDPVLWTKPADLAYNPAGPLPAMGGLYGKPYRPDDLQRARPGFSACFADASVRFIGVEISEQVIRGLITRNGGESVDVSKLE
jgi:hypothetical protein